MAHTPPIEGHLRRAKRHENVFLVERVPANVYVAIQPEER